MSILVVGSVALDTVKTPFGERKEALGGSATYFSYSASFFTKVQLVGVIGKDFPKAHIDLLKNRGIDTSGLEVGNGKTFRWAGEYEFDLNEAHTRETHLNVFETFRPKIPAAYKKTPYVFLANIDPELQMQVLSQVERPKLIACDTMNLWIKMKKPALLKLLTQVDIVILNDGEARMLAGSASLIKAARQIASFGPKHVVIKKGEHGAVLLSDGKFFIMPAFPLEEVFDPTGAGDTFAGGFVGFLAKAEKLNHATLRQAMVYGSVMASFNVEQFSLDRLTTLTPREIEERYKQFQELCHF